MMTDRQPTEAEAAILLSETFNRPAPQWAIDQRWRELREAGLPTMSAREVTGLLVAEAFGHSSDPARLAEAQRISAEMQRAAAGHVDAGPEVEQLVSEIAALVQSRWGYSPERAKLHAASEALRAREFSAQVSGVVSMLRGHRDALVKTQTVESRRRVVTG